MTILIAYEMCVGNEDIYGTQRIMIRLPLVTNQVAGRPVGVVHATVAFAWRELLSPLKPPENVSPLGRIGKHTHFFPLWT